MSGPGYRRGIALLGSTGSIGRSTLDVLRRQQDHFRLVALTAGRNRDEFIAQMNDWRPSYGGLAGVINDRQWPSGPEVLVGRYSSGRRYRRKRRCRCGRARCNPGGLARR